MATRSLMDKILGDIQDRLGAVERRVDGVELRLDRVERRLDGVELRLGGVEQRLGEFRTETRARFDLLEGLIAQQFTGLSADVQTAIREIRRVGAVARVVDDHERRITELERD